MIDFIVDITTLAAAIFIGSVAYFLSDEIEEAIKRHGLNKGRILKNPIGRLIEYHFKKIKQSIWIS